MAREIVISVLCDPCQEEGKRTEGTERLLSLGLPEAPVSPLVLALCSTHLGHLEGFLQPLLDLAQPPQKPARRGRKNASSEARPAQGKRGAYEARMGDPSAPVEERTCPECGFVSSTRSGLSSHVTNAHDTTLSRMLASPEDLQHVCEDCGATFTRAQSLGVHRRHKHDVEGESETQRLERRKRDAERKRQARQRARKAS